ncbi:vitamin K epoxide reductase family protein [Tychonema sp. BBK16]|uniref:vitamin K epoxide reductase family protein n=1 Tax=Tychonema sp. BBK16 TaxID=2699888 RepID=UPI001F1E72AE|nr:vitamin K epoxide reductase family protein [Tychonema sp. BBK16]MCF6373185.1 vitamin K epoxide reductase family protein [Tychonema sp. BBK16]
MIRRRSTPWIHSWSRTVMAAIAAIGVLETAYLTIAKFTTGSVLCPTSGCDKVLNSPYATAFGVPLSLLGCVAYLSIAILALAPKSVNPETNKGLYSQLENRTWQGLFIITAAMVVFSSYLMYLMAFEIQELCIYCISSAVFALSLFVLVLLGREWEDIGQLIFTGLLVVMVSSIAALGLYNSIKAPVTISTPGIVPPLVTTTSGPAEIALARYLTQIGAKEYGAYWCPHCHDQKMLFGREAAKLINYFECDPKGQNSRAEICQATAANLKGFPTWEIKGQFYSGTKSLEKLAEFSGYSGPRNFLKL